jgi:hypothetical protein
MKSETDSYHTELHIVVIAVYSLISSVLSNFQAVKNNFLLN